MKILNSHNFKCLLSNIESEWYNRDEDQLSTFVKSHSLSTRDTSNAWFVVLGSFYSTLCLVGISGNVWVISVLIYIFKSLRYRVCHGNVLIYILCLSIVDFLLLSLLPILVLNIVNSEWIFGRAMCKVYIAVESSCKLLSTYYLTALGFDRYIAVCHPEKEMFRSKKNTTILVFCIFLSVVLLTSPFFTSANIFRSLEDVTVENVTFVIETKMCLNNMSESIEHIFSAYTFVLGFCLPLSLILFFYLNLLIRIVKHYRSITNCATHVPIHKITVIVLVLILFYFICCSPYWFMQFYTTFTDNKSDNEFIAEKMLHANILQNISKSANCDDFYYTEESSLTGSEDPPMYPLLIMYFLHALVYVNSTFNWLLYAVFNTNFQECHMAAVQYNRASALKRARDELSQNRITESTKKSSKATMVANEKYRLLGDGRSGHKSSTVVQLSSNDDLLETFL